jgi:catechol 2,3-dioxygenase-like lactoylglutathione lyase family enzyme
MPVVIEKISAITLRVANMEASIRFYRDVLGMELLYGEPSAAFSSLCAPGTEHPILNLEQGDAVNRWGRMIFHVSDVDEFWAHLKAKSLAPEIPQNASWGARYFHLHDPNGHELSFARPL